MGFKAQSKTIDLAPMISANWAAWDGSNDGAVINICTDGGLGAQDIAAVSDTEAVIIYEDSNDGDKWKAEVLDVDTATKTFKPSGTNSIITLSGTINLGQLLQRLSPTKFVAVCSQGTGTRISLITKSGKNLIETDSVYLTDIPYNFRHGLKNLTDTKAIYHGRNDTTKFSIIFAIDISLDTITVGPLNVMGTLAEDKVVDYPDITRATENSFWVINQKKIYYCTIDGSLNITIENAITLDASSTLYDDVTATYIEDNKCLVTYERATLSTIKANVFTWNGSSITRGNESADIFGTDIFQATGSVAELGERKVMIAGRQEDDVNKTGSVAVLSVDESDNITISPKVAIFPLAIIDHTVIDTTPSGKYVFAACQDETTTPIQQIGTRILQGF
jgi:hypothetical protein